MSVRAGFSLLELAIVFIVIGLMTGAVFFGMELVNEAKLRGLIQEEKRFEDAIQIFQKKYQGLPGDLYNAEDFWGTDPGGCPNTPVDHTPKTETCNGNGDGKISYSNQDAATFSELYERARAWQQLANAGMIDGQYSGTATTNQEIPGSEFPSSTIDSSAWWAVLHHFASVDNPASLAFPMNGHMLFPRGPTTSGRAGPVLSGLEAFQVDTKIDDGQPSKGFVRHHRSWAYPNCVTTDDTETAEYYKTEGERVCVIFWLPGF